MVLCVSARSGLLAGLRVACVGLPNSPRIVRGRSDLQGRMAMPAKSERNAGKPWTDADEKRLRRLAKENTPTRVPGVKLGRTENGVRAKAQDLDVNLKPTNQSPYNRRKK